MQMGWSWSPVGPIIIVNTEVSGRKLRLWEWEGGVRKNTWHSGAKSQQQSVADRE